MVRERRAGGEVRSRSSISDALRLKEVSSHYLWMHHERIVGEHIMQRASTHSDARIKRSEGSERTRREREAWRSKERIGEGSRWTKRGGVVEGAWMTKK